MQIFIHLIQKGNYAKYTLQSAKSKGKISGMKTLTERKKQLFLLFFLFGWILHGYNLLYKQNVLKNTYFSSNKIYFIFLFIPFLCAMCGCGHLLPIVWHCLSFSFWMHLYEFLSFPSITCICIEKKKKKTAKTVLHNRNSL